MVIILGTDLNCSTQKKLLTKTKPNSLIKLFELM